MTKLNCTLNTLTLSTLLSTAICLPAIAQTTLFKNVNGYTIDGDSLKKFNAIQFTDDKIDKIFTSKSQVKADASWQVIDGNGKTMLPGLIDAHGHILSYGESLLSADLVGSKSAEEAAKRAVKFAQENEELTWITGRGWNQVQWPSQTFPTANLLDKYFPNQPVALHRVDGHAVWVNSKAMAMAGITDSTKSPSGGEIIRDDNGKATGIFIDNAMPLIQQKIAAPSFSEQKAILTKAMKNLASLGLTSVHDAGIDTSNLSAFKELTKENNMPIRVNAMLYLPSGNWQQTLAKGSFKTNDDMLQFNSVKIQADGALGSRGAAMIEDYSDKHGHRGLLLHNDKALNNFITTSMNAGFQVNTHAIGDDANKKVLDSYQQHIASTKTIELRHRVEHAQVLRLEDIPRFNDLGIIASMQATHATSDKNMAEDRVGADRIKGAYAWRKLLNANAIIAAGSDFPVESANPFFGLHASITRQDKENQPNGGWKPEEKMTRLEALKSFTIDAAYSGHQERLIGSLSAGKKADFILIDQDYFEMDEKNIWQIQVEQTWVNGQKVHSK